MLRGVDVHASYVCGAPLLERVEFLPPDRERANDSLMRETHPLPKDRCWQLVATFFQAQLHLPPTLKKQTSDINDDRRKARHAEDCRQHPLIA